MGVGGKGIQGVAGDIEVDNIAVGAGSASAPSVAVGQSDLGLYSATDILHFVTSGTSQGNIGSTGNWDLGTNWILSVGAIQSRRTDGYVLSDNAPTGTVPNLIPKRDDQDSGVGSAGADQPCVVAGGVNAVTYIENGGVLQLTQITAGITANTGSSQGDGPITSSYNEISVCANAGDAVTLPSAVAGYKVTIINNGAQACDVFPASSDNAGAGADTAVSLAAGANITYLAYDATNWATVA